MGEKRSDDVSIENADQQAFQVNENTVGDPEEPTVATKDDAHPRRDVAQNDDDQALQINENTIADANDAS